MYVTIALDALTLLSFERQLASNDRFSLAERRVVFHRFQAQAIIQCYDRFGRRSLTLRHATGQAGGTAE